MRLPTISTAPAALGVCEMTKRILVAVVCVPLLLVLLYVVSPVWPLSVTIFIAALSALAVHESLWSTGFVKNARISGLSLTLAALIPFWVHFNGNSSTALFGIYIYVVLLFAEAIRSRQTVTMEKMGGAFFLAIMIPFFLSSIVRIRQMELWLYLILMPFAAAFLSDAFALFAGMLFGKHKLAPVLSPKKTVEGSVGGLCGAVVGMLVYGLALELIWDRSVSYPLLMLYGGLGSVVSQLGDLSFSYIKREYGIKDFGNIFPGHGGVLDRFDSVIFCAPLIELLLRCLPAVS